MNALVLDPADTQKSHMSIREMNDPSGGTVVVGVPPYGIRPHAMRVVLLEAMGKTKGLNSKQTVQIDSVEGWLSLHPLRQIIVQRAHMLRGPMVEELALLSARLGSDLYFIANPQLLSWGAAEAFEMWTGRSLTLPEFDAEAARRGWRRSTAQRRAESVASAVDDQLTFDDLPSSEFLPYLWDLREAVSPDQFRSLESVFWAAVAEIYDLAVVDDNVTSGKVASWLIPRMRGHRLGRRLTVMRATQVGCFGAGWLVTTSLNRLLDLALLNDDALAWHRTLNEAVFEEADTLRAAMLVVLVAARASNRAVLEMTVAHLEIGDSVGIRVGGEVLDIPPSLQPPLRAYGHWRLASALVPEEPLWVSGAKQPVTMNYIHKLLRVAAGASGGSLTGSRRFSTAVSWANQYGIVVNRIAVPTRASRGWVEAHRALG